MTLVEISVSTQETEVLLLVQSVAQLSKEADSQQIHLEHLHVNN